MKQMGPDIHFQNMYMIYKLINKMLKKKSNLTYNQVREDTSIFVRVVTRVKWFVDT